MEAAGSKKAKKKKYNDISAGEGDVLNKPKKKKVKKEYDTDNCEEKEEVGVNEEYVPSQLKGKLYLAYYLLMKFVGNPMIVDELA